MFIYVLVSSTSRRVYMFFKISPLSTVSAKDNMITNKKKVIERQAEHIKELNDADGRSETKTNNQREKVPMVKAKVEDGMKYVKTSTFSLPDNITFEDMTAGSLRSAGILHY